MSNATTMWTHRTPSRPAARSRGGLAVLGSALGFGLGPFFATRAFATGVSPEMASFLRSALMLVVFLPALPRLRGWGREALLTAAGGAVSMLGFTAYMFALERAPVAAATVVYYTYPVFVLLLSALVWKQPLDTRDHAVAAMILAGVVLCVGPASLGGDGVGAVLLLAFAAPIGWAAFLLVLAGPVAPMPVLPKMLAGAAGGTLALAPLGMSGGMPWTAEAVRAALLLAACSAAIPAVLVTWGAPRAGERATAMIGSLELVVAVVAGWTLAAAAVTQLQVVGVALIVLAAAVAARRSPAGTRGTPP